MVVSLPFTLPLPPNPPRTSPYLPTQEATTKTYASKVAELEATVTKLKKTMEAEAAEGTTEDNGPGTPSGNVSNSTQAYFSSSRE